MMWSDISEEINYLTFFMCSILDLLVILDCTCEVRMTCQVINELQLLIAGKIEVRTYLQ